MDITDKECNSYDVIQLSRKLRGELKGKKFIIVLDNVWNEDYCTWDSLKSHLGVLRARGSKIIITTRSNRVARVMANVEPYDLKELSDDDCWSLFKDHVCGNANSYLSKEFSEIGRDIVKKCKGLPLAVKALASLLRSTKNLEDWQKILMSEIWQLQLEGKTSNNILPSMCFSYYSLPPHLKHCFAYFSIFPKGFEITEYEKEKIVLQWMAVGLLKPDLRGREAIQAGYNCFEELRSMSLLQQSSKSSTILVMHDCVHDLAAFLSGEFCFSLGDNKKTKLTGRTRHFSYSRAKEYQNFGDGVVAKHLRTCLQVPSTMNYMSLQQKEPIIPNGEFLRALCLSKAHLLVFPKSVCNSTFLGYLDLSWNDFEQVPNIICSLHNLQTLRLSYCAKLTELPTDLGMLDKLCCLDIEGVPLHKMPPQIWKLKDLVTLSQFVLGKNDCSSIKELGELCDLSGKLAIENLQNVKDFNDVKVANLQAKEYLDKIEYHWGSDDEAGHSEKERLVLDALQPHTNVKDIVISGYSADKFSKWVGINLYANTATVSISSSKCFFLPPLGQLPHLRELSIAQCNNVNKIGHEFYQESHQGNEPFRSLKVLEFKDMLKWKEWSFIKDGCFPSLEELSIQHCPTLNIYFPYGFPSLKTLFIKDMEQIFQFLPETRKIDEAFPSLERMSTENCPGILESSQLWKSFSNIIVLDFVSYGENTINWNADQRSLLSIRNCQNMVSLPKADISTVTCFCIRGLENLEALGWEEFQYFTSLEKFRIYDCRNLSHFREEMLPTTLTYLSIDRLPSLQDGGNGFQYLTCLEYLGLEDCKDLQCLTGEMLPRSLTSLEIKRLPNLQDVGNGFQHLTSLKYLGLEDCNDLQCLTREMLPTSLSSLNITELPNVKDVGEGFQHLTSLKDLTLQGLECFNIEMLPKSLTYLSISNLPNLEELVKGFQHLTSLYYLEIEGIKNMSCFAVEMLPKSLTTLRISNTICLTCLQQWLPTSLTWLYIDGLQNLKYLCESPRDLISLTKLEIKNCENLELLAKEDGNV